MEDKELKDLYDEIWKKTVKWPPAPVQTVGDGHRRAKLVYDLILADRKEQRVKLLKEMDRFFPLPIMTYILKEINKKEQL